MEGKAIMCQECREKFACAPRYEDQPLPPWRWEEVEDVGPEGFSDWLRLDPYLDVEIDFRSDRGMSSLAASAIGFTIAFLAIYFLPVFVQFAINITGGN